MLIKAKLKRPKGSKSDTLIRGGVPWNAKGFTIHIVGDEEKIRQIIDEPALVIKGVPSAKHIEAIVKASSSDDVRAIAACVTDKKVQNAAGRRLAELRTGELVLVAGSAKTERDVLKLLLDLEGEDLDKKEIEVIKAAADARLHEITTEDVVRLINSAETLAALHLLCPGDAPDKRIADAFNARQEKLEAGG